MTEIVVPLGRVRVGDGEGESVDLAGLVSDAYGLLPMLSDRLLLLCLTREIMRTFKSFCDEHGAVLEKEREARK